MKRRTSRSHIVLRVEITPKALQEMETTIEQFGMKKVAMVSRLVTWVVDQPEVVQAMILGLYPEDGGKDISSEETFVTAVNANRSEHGI